MDTTKYGVAQRNGALRGGSGEPLVLLHAGGASPRLWEPVLPRLTAYRDVLAPALLGNLGGRQLNSGPLSARAIADDAERDLDAAGFGVVDVVGNSLGGFAALELARRGRVRNLVAISPMGMQTSEKAEKLIRVLVRGHRVAVPAKPLVMPALAVPVVRQRLLYTVLGVVHGERVPTALARHLFHALTSCDVPAAFAAIEAADLRIRDVGEITTRTLLIRGTRDPIATRDQIDGYSAGLPNASLLELPGLGHCPQLEDPERVAAEILRFLGDES
ncbi:alpha/beta fold hydrolase [Nocardia sp. CA-136227]|uniref:alpha/beta fold hydrolase n=1 Tax=Nocardia sp. CA-136227 TaxID=3239979 RepID=UPI003D985482